MDRWSQAAATNGTPIMKHHARVKPASQPHHTAVTTDVEMARISEPALPAREKMDRAMLDELRESMRTIGLLYPLILVRKGSVLEIADGHRRFLAARELGWTRIMARVWEDEQMEGEAAKVHAMLMREDWNPAEEAIFYGQLMERDHLDLDGLCRLVGRSADYISDRCRLLRGDRAVFEALRSRAITLVVARALNRCDDDMYRASFLDQAIRSGTSGRVVEVWVEEWKGRALPGPQAGLTTAESTPPPSVEPYHRACALCGGDRDQFNLVDVVLHKWEWEMLRDTLEKAAQNGVSLKDLSEGIDKIEG